MVDMEVKNTLSYYSIDQLDNSVTAGRHGNFQSYIQ